MWQPSFKASATLAPWHVVFYVVLSLYIADLHREEEKGLLNENYLLKGPRDKSIKNGFEIIWQQNLLLQQHKNFEYWWGMLQNWSYHPGLCFSLVSFSIDTNCRGIREVLIRVCLLALRLWGLVLTLQGIGMLLHCYICAMLSKNVNPLRLKGMWTRNWLAEGSKGKMAWDITLLNTEAFFSFWFQLD